MMRIKKFKNYFKLIYLKLIIKKTACKRKKSVGPNLNLYNNINKK